MVISVSFAVGQQVSRTAYFPTGKRWPRLVIQTLGLDTYEALCLSQSEASVLCGSQIWSSLASCRKLARI